jgi:hypothetical protein
VNLIKNYDEKIDDLLETPKSSEVQALSADDSVLIEFSTKATKVLYAGKGEGKEGFTYKVKVMRRHGETWQFAFSDKDNKCEIEREGIVAKFLRPNSLGYTPCITTLKYCGINFCSKELYRDIKSVL